MKCGTNAAVEIQQHREALKSWLVGMFAFSNTVYVSLQKPNNGTGYVTIKCLVAHNNQIVNITPAMAELCGYKFTDKWGEGGIRVQDAAIAVMRLSFALYGDDYKLRMEWV